MASSLESLRLLVELQKSASDVRRQAVASAYRRYFLRMIGLLRKRLPAYLCQRAEPDDLAQSAWLSFLRAYDDGRLDLESRGSLWPLLARIAICKLHDLTDAAHAKKRDVALNQSMAGEWDVALGLEPASGEPCPEEEAAAAETTELLASRLSDPRQQQVLAMHLGGYSVREISDEVGLSERTVKRILRKVRDLYAELAGVTLIDEDAEDLNA